MAPASTFIHNNVAAAAICDWVNLLYVQTLLVKMGDRKQTSNFALIRNVRGRCENCD